jgi:ComF family protein
MNRLRRLPARAAGRAFDDVAAFLFPEVCRGCGAGDVDAPFWRGTGRPRSRLQDGRLRRRILGPLSLPLRLLCASCCEALVPLRVPVASAPSLDVVAFEPSPVLFTLVHALKYDGIVELIPWFGARLARVARRLLPRGPLALVPVPLHAQRLAERGFNQSALLAHDVGARLGVPVWEALLVRREATPPLAQLAHVERRIRVENAFVRRSSKRSDAIRVVLVDDVITTGATRDAARAALGEPAARRAAFLGLCRAREASRWSYEPRINCGRRG